MHKLNVGIIGLGMAFERLHYPAYQKLAEQYQLTALCDVDSKKTNEWAQKLQISRENTYPDWQKNDRKG